MLSKTMEQNLLLIAAKAAAENVKRNEFKELHPFKEDDVNEAVKDALGNINLRNEIRKLLYPEGIIIGEVFFEKLQEFYVLLGFHSIVNELISEISIDIFKGIEKKDVEKLLNFLVNTKSRYFWIYLRTFVFLFQKYTLDSKFISKWFIEICEKMGNDLASGDFYTAIGNYAFSFPLEGLQILKLYSNAKIEKITLHISSIIMGNVRARIITDTKDILDFDEVEEDYHENKNVDKRAIYYCSYLHTYHKIEPSIDELDSILNEAIRDEDKVKEQAYFIINRYVNSKREDSKIVDFGLNWIEKNIHSSSSDMCKYNAVDLLRWIVFEDRKEKSMTIFPKINRILEKTLPIQIDNGGTWSNIQDLLRDTLVIDLKEFEKMILTISNNSSKEFLHYLKDQQFDFLTHELENVDIKDFILGLVTSRKKNERSLGFTLLRELHSKYPDTETKISINDEQALQISLLEAKAKLILGKEICEYLISIEPFFRNKSKALQKDFIREMVFQAINYPGECLEKWKKIENPSEIFKVVIESANSYFEKLNNTADLSANSYCLPIFIKAEQEVKRKMSKNISEGAYEKSIFMKFIKKTNVLYGDKWSVNHDKSIGNPTQFSKFSHSFELPRLEYLDPEGIVLRRIKAKIELKNLVK
ncbi:MAG: hypothetical protein K8I03_01380 [Ignavibacteria bacterium]|nr:hypothetical protein [Ignavibacteria bacterium]